MTTRPMFRSRFPLAWLRLVIAALICCASTASAQEREEGDDGPKGVVIGTVVVRVAEPTNSSVLRAGRKLDEAKWALQLVRAKSFFFRKQVSVRSGSDEHFLLELGAGSYTFDQLIAQGFANFYFPVGVRFDVTPGTTTYIGTLQILLPYRMYDGPADYNVADSQAETVEALRSDHPELAGGVTTRLMVLEE